MKKVLLATTALVATAGIAAADVSLSGYAEIGINGSDTEDDNTTAFHSDIDVTFTLSGETDGGLAFGATIDLDEVGDDGDPVGDSISQTNANGSATEEQSVFVSGDFGTITLGDTDGAFDWALSEIGWGTSLTDDHTTHAGFDFNSGLDGQLNGQVARYDYAFGDFAVALSAEIGDGTDPENEADDDDFFDDDEIFGIGAKYSTELGGAALGFGLGYQTGSMGSLDTGAFGNDFGGQVDADALGMSLSVGLAMGLEFRANLQNYSGDGESNDGVDIDVDIDHYGIGVAYIMDNLVVEANYGEFDGDLNDEDFNADGYGLAMNYDIGGGAVVMVGYGNGTPNGADDSVSTYSAGLGLSF